METERMELSVRERERLKVLQQVEEGVPTKNCVLIDPIAFSATCQ
jgi:hypothetical protein